jgi:CheY-like chemotaxis protein
VEHVLAFRPGVELLSAAPSAAGLALARERRPRLILLDLNLPDLHGQEVFRGLRELPATRDIPVVVVSADATEHQVQRLLAEGARAYLTKPLDVRRLLEVLDAALAEGGEA